MMAHARLASWSTGRCDLPWKGERLVLQVNGITWGGRREQRAVKESGGLYLNREGKVGQRWAAAGLIVGAAQTSNRAAMRRVWGMIAWRRGMWASADNIVVGVDQKQLNMQHWT